MKFTQEEKEFIDQWSQCDDRCSLAYFIHQGNYKHALDILAGSGALEDIELTNPDISDSINRKIEKIGRLTYHSTRRALSEAVVVSCSNCNHHQFFHTNEFSYEDDLNYCPSCASNRRLTLENDYSRCKTFNKWATKLTQAVPDVFTESDITALCSHLNGYKASKLTDGDRSILHDLISTYGPFRITEEQTQKGLDWFSRRILRKDGTLRQTKDQPFGQREADIINDFGWFKWAGVTDDGNQYRSLFRPVYSCHSMTHECFEYYVGTDLTVHVVG